MSRMFAVLAIFNLMLVFIPPVVHPLSLVNLGATVAFGLMWWNERRIERR